MRLAKKGKLDDAIALVADTPKSRQSEVVWNHLIQESSKLSKGNQSWSLLSDVSTEQMHQKATMSKDLP
jgi:hypothetical protein